jgi:hypothetical protein
MRRTSPILLLVFCSLHSVITPFLRRSKTLARKHFLFSLRRFSSVLTSRSGTVIRMPSLSPTELSSVLIFVSSPSLALPILCLPFHWVDILLIATTVTR